MSADAPRFFLDTDVLLDLALDRTPFGVVAQHLFARVEAGTFQAATSTVVLVNAYYVLRKAVGHERAKAFLTDLTTLVEVVDTDAASWRLALRSPWGDLEDAVQHFCAVSHGLSAVVTRNGDDWKSSVLPVYLPEEYLALYQTT